MTFDGVLALASEAAVDVPLVLFSYLNPIVAAGPTALARAAAAESTDCSSPIFPWAETRESSAKSVSRRSPSFAWVAPTTPAPRMAEIARHGSGFVYLMPSRLGVTGMRSEIASGLADTIPAPARSHRAPGVRRLWHSRAPEQAASVARLADGVVVGSAVVRAAETSVESAVALVRSMRKAIDER